MEVFRFKEFSIQQDRCAMKVGTDGVLLGAWTTVKHKPNAILDVGAGTGLIALQMAQRTTAEIIDAIELDENAFEQCVENFEASLWSDRLFCYHAAFQEFFEEVDETYDIIISNPPFFKEGVPSRNPSRDTARQQSSLPFDNLLYGVSKLLSKTGHFAVILPFYLETEFNGIAKNNGLFPIRITRVRGNKSTEIKRSLIEFSLLSSHCEYNELVIELERNKYTNDYINLTKDFYLKM